jgi:hypothetical protein
MHAADHLQPLPPATTTTACSKRQSPVQWTNSGARRVVTTPGRVGRSCGPRQALMELAAVAAAASRHGCMLHLALACHNTPRHICDVLHKLMLSCPTRPTAHWLLCACSLACPTGTSTNGQTGSAMVSVRLPGWLCFQRLPACAFRFAFAMPRELTPRARARPCSAPSLQAGAWSQAQRRRPAQRTPTARVAPRWMTMAS